MQALMDALSLEEMAGLLSPDPAEGNTCDTHSGAVPRLGISNYMWLTETNSDVAASCPEGASRCRTSFYGPLGCGASFNETAMRVKGRVLSFELRAFRNAGLYRPIGRSEEQKEREKIGVTAFGPNLNIPRDPRFGRLSELPGEDPFLTGTLGAAMVQGLQEPDAKGRPRALAFMKHFAAYSVEENRGHDNYNISAFDLADTYLRQYEIVSRRASPAGAMCSYNAINGAPACANDFILNKVFREQWGLQDGIITSDCGAVGNLLGAPVFAPDKATASAWAINNGTDLEMGSTILRDPQGLALALERGQVSAETVKRSARRLLKALMRAGLFDAFGDSEFDHVPIDVVGGDVHDGLAHEVALQAPVLLRNDLDVLPLEKGKNLAILGPQGADPESLWSDYASKPRCPNGSSSCAMTLVDAFASEGFDVSHSEGVPREGPPNETDTALAMQLARLADVVVLTLGTSRSQERETLDRKSTDLPGFQADFAKSVLALGKPTIIVLQNGGPISEDWLVSAFENPLAIVETFTPNARGMRAVVQLLSGRENRWGKLPYTMYPSAYQHQVSKFDFDMSKPPGRTYRYYTGPKALFPFGFGLSYTTFSLQACKCSRDAVFCAIRNTGPRRGDEVLQVYHVPSASQADEDERPTPLQTLVGFRRISLEIGESRKVEISVDPYAYQLPNQRGERKVRPGVHTLAVRLGTLGGSADDTQASVCQVIVEEEIPRKEML
ncbi:Periplasmic beta-glucosidase [Hondaea fermentalgiana]|uniref:Periplasmic beta-glucosidase n=1 Tax=Hondaea fermentalgiana TaxID=2315210 RepID=A0A2R5GN67_9STRA|nr:Periplasmic beta-glucosidase [Hondaea fermentalgiana]|eukprot:GBG31178.1 Periplasmic beta-glucosidase [Hondaea fermentalgiana]